jgi:hypothetical protein
MPGFLEHRIEATAAGRLNPYWLGARVAMATRMARQHALFGGCCALPQRKLLKECGRVSYLEADYPGGED